MVRAARSACALEMSALPSPRLPLPELMELCLHRLDSSLDVVPGVPRRLMMDSVDLVYMRHVYRVNLMNRRPFLPGRGRGGGRGRRARDRVELVVPVHAARVDRVLQMSMDDLPLLVLELEPPADERRRRRSVRRRPPFRDGAAAPRALVLLGGVLAPEAGAARPALRRCLEVRRGGELRRGSRVASVPGR